MITDAQFVVLHAKKKSKRGKKPSLSYKGEKNPKEALLLASVDIEESLSASEMSDIDDSDDFDLFGTGDYCPDCGGLCGNEKHTRRW